MPAAEYTYRPGDRIVTEGATYRVERELGKGGAGCTYKAINNVLNAPCVVKVMHGAAARDAAACKRFLDEAQTSAQIGRHPNLVTVTHFGHVLGEDGRGKGTPFHVMEYVHGATLRQFIAASPDETERRTAISLRLTIGMLYGLARMHERGIVHRDIKPDNVLVAKDDKQELVARIIDLGAAYLLADTGPQAQILTWTYAAPEQFDKDARLDPKVDVFATGLVLFEMLTKRHPYADYGGSPQRILQRLSVPAPLLSEFGSFPEPLTRVLLDAMALDPTQRPTPVAMLRVLQEIGNQLQLRSGPDGDPTTPDLELPITGEGPITRAHLVPPTEPGEPPDFGDENAKGGNPFGIVVAPSGRGATTPLGRHHASMPRRNYDLHGANTATAQPEPVRSAWHDTSLMAAEPAPPTRPMGVATSGPRPVRAPSRLDRALAMFATASVALLLGALLVVVWLLWRRR